MAVHGPGKVSAEDPLHKSFQFAKNELGRYNYDNRNYDCDVYPHSHNLRHSFQLAFILPGYFPLPFHADNRYSG